MRVDFARITLSVPRERVREKHFSPLQGNVNGGFGYSISRHANIARNSMMNLIKLILSIVGGEITICINIAKPCELLLQLLKRYKTFKMTAHRVTLNYDYVDNRSLIIRWSCLFQF